jgi:hypothetical protein
MPISSAELPSKPCLPARVRGEGTSGSDTRRIPGEDGSSAAKAARRWTSAEQHTAGAAGSRDAFCPSRIDARESPRKGEVACCSAVSSRSSTNASPVAAPKPQNHDSCVVRVRSWSGEGTDTWSTSSSRTSGVGVALGLTLARQAESCKRERLQALHADGGTTHLARTVRLILDALESVFDVVEELGL